MSATMRRNPPGPKSRVLGLDFLSAIRRQPIAFMEKLTHRYGDFVHFRVAHANVYLVNSPDYVKEIFSNHYTFFRKGRGIDRRSTFLGEGLISSEGKLHQQQRVTTQPAFHRQRLNEFADAMARTAEEISARWGADQPVDLLGQARRMTMRIISETLFRADTTEAQNRIFDALQVSLESFSALSVPLPWILEKFRLWTRHRANHATRVLEAMIRDLRKSSADHGGENIFTMIEERSDVPGDERQILNEALTLFLAGYETSALALTFTWYLIARHPEVQSRIQDEVDAVVGSRLPRFDDLPSLCYTKMVLEEGMRMYPPSWRLMRCATKGFDLNGYTIPAGSYVIVSQWLMHRNPRYFAEPNRFDPERWTPEARAQRPQYSYFPFGGAPRRCIGEAFGILEAVMILATVARRWNMTDLTGPELPLRQLHLLQPDRTVRVAVEAR